MSTMNLDGIVNFAPVGIQFNQKEKLLFTVFHSTTTFLNLKCQPCGVVNFTSDVLLFAKTALYDHVPNYSIDKNGKAAILDNADEALEFIVESTENMGNKSKFFCIKSTFNKGGLCLHPPILSAIILHIAKRIEFSKLSFSSL